MAEVFYIERKHDGEYRALRPNATRASFVALTQSQCIAKVKKSYPNATIHIERVRKIGPGPDKWR